MGVNRNIFLNLQCLSRAVDDLPHGCITKLTEFAELTEVMIALVLTFDRNASITEHMMFRYREVWPDHPFVFRILTYGCARGRIACFGRVWGSTVSIAGGVD